MCARQNCASPCVLLMRQMICLHVTGYISLVFSAHAYMFRDPKSIDDATLVVTSEGHATIEHLYRELRQEDGGSASGF